MSQTSVIKKFLLSKEYIPLEYGVFFMKIWVLRWNENTQYIHTLSPALSVCAVQPDLSTRSWPRLTLCLAGLSVTWPQHGLLLFWGCILQDAAEHGQSRPGQMMPGSAPAILLEGHHCLLQAVSAFAFLCVSVCVCERYLLLPAQWCVLPCHWCHWPPSKSKAGRASPSLHLCCCLAVVTSDPAFAQPDTRTLDNTHTVIKIAHTITHTLMSSAHAYLCQPCCWPSQAVRWSRPWTVWPESSPNGHYTHCPAPHTDAIVTPHPGTGQAVVLLWQGKDRPKLKSSRMHTL